MRLLTNIFQVGLFENPYLDLEESLAEVGKDEYREKGYLSRLKSMVLLKNADRTLPLAKKTKVFIPDRHVKPCRPSCQRICRRLKLTARIYPLTMRPMLTARGTPMDLDLGWTLRGCSRMKEQPAFFNSDIFSVFQQEMKR